MMTAKKPKLSRRGHQILESALKAMQTKPESFDMQYWIRHDRTIQASKKVSKPYCGTVACLAGHIALAATKQLPNEDGVRAGYAITQLPKRVAQNVAKRYAKQYPWLVDDSTIAVRAVAIAALGVNEHAANQLFHMIRWPIQLATSFTTETNPEKKVAIAIQRVRHWLKTGE